MAGRLEQWLRARDVEVFSSDLLRAAQTVDTISGRLRVETILMSALREMSYGGPKGNRRRGLTPVRLQLRTTIGLITEAGSRTAKPDAN